MLELKLSKPQQRRIINIVDGLIVTETRKTLAEIQRQYVSCVDPSNIADTFRIAPWKTDEIRQPLVEFLMKTALKYLDQINQPRRLLINLDDSLAIKDPDTRCLQGVDWYYDHASRRRKRHRIQNALAYLGCNIVAGDWNFTFSIRSYLRQNTVQRINRKRHPNAPCRS
jgi:hypothetical protein